MVKKYCFSFILCLFTSFCLAQMPEELKGFKKSVDGVLLDRARYTPDCSMYNFAIKYEVEKDSLVDISVSDGIDSALGAQIIYYLKLMNHTSLLTYIRQINRLKTTIIIPVTLVKSNKDCLDPKKTEKFQLFNSLKFKGKPFFGDCILFPETGFHVQALH